MAFRIKDGVRVGTVDVFDNSGVLLVKAPGWITARTITLGGDLSGSVSIDGTSNVTLTATVAADSVALGTDTTGNYMVNVTGSNGVAITHTQGEGSTAAAALTGQALAFHNLASNGIVARTAADTVAARTITAGTGISVSNGDGVSGNPTITNSDLGSAQNIYKNISDGTTTASAGSNNDTIKFRVGTGITAVVGSNDATHGDNILFTNTGVTSAVAGTGISVSGATGAVTITNSGVTSAVAGTDITVSGATGAVTIATNSTLATVTGRGATTTTAVSLTNSTASTTTGTGALIVTGGVGVGGQINVGGATNTFSASTASTTTGTGAVVVTGGVGVGGQLNVGGATSTFSASTASSTTTTGAVVVTGGVGIGGALNVGGATSVGGNLTITGNLIVNGTTQTTNSTTVTIDDPVFTLGGDTAPTSDDNKDRGIEFRWHNGTVAKVGFFGFDDSTGKFTFIPDATNTSEVFSGAVGEIDATIAWGNVTGRTTVGTNLGTLANPSAVTFLRINADNSVSTLAAGAFRTALGSTTVGDNLFTLANPSAVTFLRVNADNTVSALDAASFRTAIGVGTGTGTVTSVATGTGLTGGPITSTGTIALTGQALAIHNLASNGIVARTAADTFTARSVAAGTGTAVTNGDGVAGNPTVALTGQALAFHNLASFGMVALTAANTVAARTITAGTGISVSNGDGVSGNPTITNSGVTSAVAGTDITVSGATGAVTIATNSTLATVTGRGNTTTSNIQLNNAELVLAPSTTARIFRRAVQPAAIAVNTATAVDSWATATYRSAEYTIQVVQGSKYQISKIVMIHDGTSVYLTEYAVNENSNIPVTFTASIATGTLTLNATITDAATTNATVTLERKLFAV